MTYLIYQLEWVTSWTWSLFDFSNLEKNLFDYSKRDLFVQSKGERKDLGGNLFQFINSIHSKK